MRAGLLRERIRIERAIRTKGSVGGQSIVWSHQIYSWARFQPEDGTDSEAAGKQRAVVRWKVTIRYWAALNATDYRIKREDGTLAAILAVLPNKKEGSMILQCETGGAAVG